MATRRVKRTRIVRDERLGVDYARYSEEQQGSVDDQQGTNREVAAEEKVRITRSFADKAISRSIQDRPDLIEMFGYLDAHPEIGFIIVNELERLTAGVAQRDQITSMCQRLNIAILTEDIGEIDPFDEEKMQEADERAVKAKGEVIKGQRRTRRNLKQKVIGGTIVMRPAYGIRFKPLIGPDGKPLLPGMKMVNEHGRTIRSGKIEEHPDEIDWLRLIFKLADEGQSDAAIARYLTAQGVPTKSGNQMWRANTIAGILTNPFYKGEMTWGKQAVKRYSDGKTYLETRDESDPGRINFPNPLGPLVDIELWERVNLRRATRRDEIRIERRTNEQKVFDNRIYCLACGYKMYGQLNNAGKRAREVRRRYKPPVWRYYCYSGRRNAAMRPGFGPPCVVSHGISVPRLLAEIAKMDTVEGSSITVRTKRSVGAEADLRRKQLEKQIASATASFQRAKALHIEDDTIVTKDELKTQKVAMDQTIASAKGELDRLTLDASAVPSPSTMIGTINSADLAALLADESLAVTDRAKALDDAGIVRFFVRHPVVEVEISG